MAAAVVVLEIVEVPCKVLFVQDVEAGRGHGPARLVARVQVTDPVPSFHAVAHVDVFGVAGVESGCQDPFTHAEHAAGFEDAADVGVDGAQRGCVAGGFDGEGGVEAVVGEGQVLFSKGLSESEGV